MGTPLVVGTLFGVRTLAGALDALMLALMP